jgi:hypothetical protein
VIDKSKLVRVKPGEENRGVNEEQRKNLAEAGLAMAKQLGIDKPIPGLARPK